ncbi:speedy protein A-like isoform X2 [Trichogramma pretiosum]|nr:speedy protein A-like isoform X2 [Trichogramma pretiosum]
MDSLNRRDFVASPYRSEREKVICIKRWNVRRFFKLIGICSTSHVKMSVTKCLIVYSLIDKLDDFFENDKCCRLADNYLIAMVFTYFLRATFEPEEYTFTNFFAALFLAYDMEEDDGQFMIQDLEPWLDCSLTDLKQARCELFARVDFRAAVSRACCDIVMRVANPEHMIWKRRRHSFHSGIVHRRLFLMEPNQEICPICEGQSETDDEDISY